MTVAELVAKLGVNLDRESWENATHSIEKLKHGLEGAIEALAVHEIKEWVEHIIEGAVESAVQVKRLSDSIGISTDRIQEMGFAAKEIGMGGLSMALRRMSVTAMNAAEGNKGAMHTFRELGVSIYGVNGQLLPADKLMERVADGLHRVHNPMQRVAAATALFGRQGMVMARVLKDGSEGLKKKYEEARKLGIMSEHMIELAEKEHHAQIEVDYAQKALRNTIAEKLLPAKTWMLDKTREVVEWFVRLARQTDIVREGAAILSVILVALAVRSFWAFLMVLGPVGSALLLIGAVLWLVIDDLNHADGFLRNFITRWEAFVKDFANPDNVKKNEHWLITFLRSTVELIDKVIEKAGLMANALGFGTHYQEKASKAYQDELRAKGILKDVPRDQLVPMSPSEAGMGMLAGVVNYAAGRDPGFYRTASPSSQAAVAAQSSVWPGASPMTVNQTINALPGQSEHSIANESVDGFQTALEQAHSKLVPQMAATPAGG